MALPGHCLFSGLIRSQSVLPMVFKRLWFFSRTLFSTSCVGKLLAVSPGRHFLPRCLSACKGLGGTFHGEGWHGHGNGIPHSLSPKALLRRELQLPEPWSAGGLNQMTAKKLLCRWWQDRRSHSCEMKYIHHTVQKYANLQLSVLDKTKKCVLSHSGERESKISITVSMLILLLFVAHYSLQNTKRPQLGLNAGLWTCIQGIANEKNKNAPLKFSDKTPLKSYHNEWLKRQLRAFVVVKMS